MRMLKCAPRAFARCPYRKQCSDSPEHTSFYEGTECDYFNQQVINKPMTNADSIRAMSDEELAILLCRIMDCSICKRNIQKDGECDNYSADGLSKAVLNWLQRPVEEDT